MVYDKNKKAIVKTTKTIAGTRFVPLPQYLINEIKNWAYFGCSPSMLQGWFYRTIEKVDIPHFSFHKLRHYFASELHAQCVPDKYIAKIGGWETTAVLQNIYQHTLRDKQEEIETKVVDIFNTNFEKCNTKCNTQINITPAKPVVL